MQSCCSLVARRGRLAEARAKIAELERERVRGSLRRLAEATAVELTVGEAEAQNEAEAARLDAAAESTATEAVERAQTRASPAEQAAQPSSPSGLTPRLHRLVHCGGEQTFAVDICRQALRAANDDVDKAERLLLASVSREQ